MRTYCFKVYVNGTGLTPEDAWQDAVEALNCDPGPVPDDYETVEDDEEGEL